MERLVSAILLMAIRDWSNPRTRPEVEAFLDSEWFVSLTQSIGLESEVIRIRWKAGEFGHMEIRAAYR